MHLTKAGLSVIALALGASIANAQSSSAEAESLFAQARGLMAEKKYAEACAAFESSNRLQASATTMYSLGVCREIEGKLATAWGVMIDFDRQYRSTTDPAITELVKKARERAKVLQPRLSSLTIAVPAASRADDLAIERDGATIDRGTWDRPLPVDGGAHTIAVRRPGYQAWSTTITLQTEGEAQTVTIPSLEPAPVAEEPEKPTAALVPPPIDAPPPRSTALPIAFAAGALVLGGAAIGFDLWGRGMHDDAQARATLKMNARDPGAVNLQNGANLRRYLAQGFGVAAVGCAVVSVVLFVRGGSSESTSTKTTLAPIVTHEGGGFAVTGAW